MPADLRLSRPSGYEESTGFSVAGAAFSRPPTSTLCRPSRPDVCLLATEPRNKKIKKPSIFAANHQDSVQCDESQPTGWLAFDSCVRQPDRQKWGRPLIEATTTQLAQRVLAMEIRSAVGVVEFFMLFLFGGGAGIPLGVPPTEPDPIAIKIAPEETLYYSTWAGMATPAADSKNQTEQLLAEPEPAAVLRRDRQAGHSRAAGSGGTRRRSESPPGR